MATEEGYNLITLEVDCDGISWNDIATAHWKKYYDLKKQWKARLGRLILVEIGRSHKVTTFGVRLYSNLNTDVDNRLVIMKFFCDALKAQGVIEDDRPKFMKFCSSAQDDTMEKGTMRIEFHFKQ